MALMRILLAAIVLAVACLPVLAQESYADHRAATLARHGVWVGNLSRVQIPIAGIRPFDRDSGCEVFRISGEQRIFT